ncbi:MAG: Arm DNA-binding domain-containing protein [Gallionella sp.]
MARHLIASDRTILTKKPTAATIRLSDGDGLYLLLKPNGARWWRFDYSIGGKRKTLSIGVYPDTGLKAARKEATKARELVAMGTVLVMYAKRARRWKLSGEAKLGWLRPVLLKR